MRAIGAALLLVVLATGCMRLDVFVFRPKPAPADAGDLMATSRVPEALRQELVDEITSVDGVKVSGWLLTHTADDGTPVERHGLGILYCHGNNTHIGTTVPRLDALWALGYTVLAFDPRGFGKTPVPDEGQTQEGVQADTDAAWAYLAGREDLGMSPDRVGLYARSLGTAFCLQTAVDVDAPAVLLESPIGSLRDMIDTSTGLATPSQWYVDSAMDSPSVVEGFKGALLVMHGTEDDFVQPAYGQEIHDRATAARTRELWLVPGADHGSVPCVEHVTSPPDNDCPGGFSDEWKSRTIGLFDAALQ